MSGVDISVACSLAAFAAIGGWKGFSWQATHLLAVVAGFILATGGASNLARLGGEPNSFGRSIAWLGIFALVVITAHLLAFRLKEKIAEYKLKSYDRELGAVLGAFKGGLLVSMVLFFLAVPVSPMRRKILSESYSGVPFAMVLERFHRFVPADLHREVHPPGRPGGPGHWGTPASRTQPPGK